MNSLLLRPKPLPLPPNLAILSAWLSYPASQPAPYAIEFDVLPSGIAKVHPKTSKVECGGELCSQNDSKMEPKIEPKVIQKGSLLKNTKNFFFAAIYYT